MRSNLNDTYCFVTKKGEELSFVKILKGPLEGCIVRINHVKFGDEENPDGTLDMHINYDWEYKPKGKKFGKKKIMETLGPICIDILEQDFEGFAAAAKLD